MTDLKAAALQALKWADNQGEIVFCFGGWKAVDGMNAWTQALRTALVQQDCTYTVKEMADKPEALRLADALQQQAVWEGHYGPSYLRDLLPEAAAELRRLHAANLKLAGAIDMIRETLKGGNVDDLLYIINAALEEHRGTT